MKRHPALRSLSGEHHHGLVLAHLLKHGRKSFTSSEVLYSAEELKNELIKFFKKDLTSHFQKEEQVLLSYFPKEELMKRMISEHKQMEFCFDEICQLDDEGFLKIKLRQFQELLENHIRFEEKELFTMMENSLNENQLSELENKLNEFNTDS